MYFYTNDLLEGGRGERDGGGETITRVDFTTMNSKTISAQVLYIQLLREMHSISQFHLLN